MIKKNNCLNVIHVIKNEAIFQRSSGISTKEFSQMYQKINGIIPRVYI